MSGDGGIGTAKLGQILFGVDGNTAQVRKCVYAKIKTTDPFNPEVISQITGIVGN
jgi:hypothetical protein